MFPPILFESCAVYDGTQTTPVFFKYCPSFKSCAVYDGTQTAPVFVSTLPWFESCAVYDGTQTKSTLWNDTLQV